MVAITQRQASLGVLAVVTALEALLIGVLILEQAPQWITILAVIACLSTAALLGAYWRGWEYARHMVVILTTLLVMGGVRTEGIFISALLPPVLALVLVGTWWIVGTGVATIAGIWAVNGGFIVYLSVLPVYLMLVAGLVLGRLVLETALRAARIKAEEAQELQLRAEQNAAQISAQAQTLSEQNAQQQQLLDLIGALEAPAVQLAPGVLLSPLTGYLDTQRIERLTRHLLETVHTQRVQLVVLDVAGIATIDTGVANRLLQIVQAVRLLGCRITLTGISAGVAQTLTTLGVQFNDISIAASPHEALQVHRN